jgi:hypothetical protein
MEEKKIQLDLIQRLGTFNYKIIIPENVEKKIRYICNRVWNTEWSGTLFFNYSGSFENDDLTITCKDIYVMDIGTQTYTEFDMSPDVISYMTENPELLDCQMGLIHSHNNMSTFFSGTDTATLREEGTDRNNFVSLIVNNSGNYTAAITRKVLVENIQASVTYELFGEGRKTIKEEYSSSKEKIEWFYLKVEKAEVDAEFKDIDTKLKEIRDNKNKTLYTPAKVTNYGSTVNTPTTKESNNKNIFQKDLFDKEDSLPYGSIRFDEDTIKTLVMQIITGSIFVSKDSKIDPIKWVNNLPNLCKRRFGDDKLGKNEFSSWADTYIEFLLWGTADKKLEEMGLSEADICAICAYDIIEALEELPKNEYINIYIEALQNYII